MSLASNGFRASSFRPNISERPNPLDRVPRADAERPFFGPARSELAGDCVSSHGTGLALPKSSRSHAAGFPSRDGLASIRCVIEGEVVVDHGRSNRPAPTVVKQEGEAARRARSREFLRRHQMMRFEYVWSLLVACFVMCGAVVWTAASQPSALPAVISPLADSTQAPRQRSSCREYAQYEFKVGCVISPNCLPQAN
jgi:hypothetical protein